MSDKPDDIMQDAWETAKAIFSKLYDDEPDLEGNCERGVTIALADAIQTEREACANRAGTYLILKTGLAVDKIVECEAKIRSGEPQ